MVRYEDWPQRLSTFIKSMRETPFQWGINDCVMASAKAVEALTGINYYDEYLGYTDEAGANEIIAKNGGLEALITKHLGPSHPNKLKAKRGDLALIKTPAKSIGIIDDTGQYVVGMSDKGFVKVPLSKAWRVWSY